MNAIAVIGDIMLDKYLGGDTTRISPEAPVPVVKIHENREVLGGAGNVISNISAFGTDVITVTGVCKDFSGSKITSILETLNCEALLFDFEDRPTTVKTRVMVGGHQVSRFDEEHNAPLHGFNDFLSTHLNKIADCKVVVLSDYGKGILSNSSKIIKTLKTNDCFIIVDPKSNDYSNYAGADLITPNLSEFHAVVGNVEMGDELLSAARTIMSANNIASILITLGSKGMHLVTPTEDLYFEAEAKSVFDVTGAGDTVVATIADWINQGSDLKSACQAANVAAGIVVGKVGSATVNKEEIYKKLHENNVSDDDFDNIHLLRKSGKKIVFTNGCFDILHAGHLKTLKKSKEKGDILVVGLNSDESVRKLKGPSRPVNSFSNRAALLKEFKCVDFVIEFTEETPLNLIKKIKPQVLIKGKDYEGKEIVGQQFVEENGGEVALIELEPDLSTTKILELIGDNK